ncbi:MAG TPA: lipid A deacylase LpxR family protein [Gemmatimonadaceae bacterium]|nr:lipid A deacylase LpxR family protein [Gemmatimonadaceae bacterium]
MIRFVPNALLCLAAVPLSIGTAVAQSSAADHAPAALSAPDHSPKTFSLRADNDAFDFWMLPWNRPDEDYTSGVHLDYDGGDAPRWSHGLMKGRGECVVHARTCRTSRLELGQDIYTPSVDVNDPHAAAAARPNAGWLYLAQSARALSEERLDEFTLTLGVTGPPSLARMTQRLAHEAAPEFNRPTDWSHQIAFEPGAILRYEQQRRAWSAHGSPVGADVIPTGGVSLGNVLTAADAGLRIRSGWNLAHPWLPEPPSAGFTIDGGVSAQAIARNLFLDGNTFERGPRVGHEPFVGTADLGVELTYRALSLEYRAVNQTRAYAAGPKWHPWASMVGRVTVGR